MTNPISLSKISLEKKGQSVSLEKRSGGFGDISVNLNWNQGGQAPKPAPTEPKGIFGRLFGSAPPPRPQMRAPSIDLDLGCLFEMMDGNKGAVQALGGNMGSFSKFPFIELSGDDRTGSSQDGETIRINGAEWAKIRRIAVYAFIYEGVANWGATDGVVTVQVPGERPIEVRMTEGRNERTMCCICIIENDGGRMKVTQAVDYFSGHKDLDRAHGWGMRWVAGSKD